MPRSMMGSGSTQLMRTARILLEPILGLKKYLAILRSGRVNSVDITLKIDGKEKDLYRRLHLGSYGKKTLSKYPKGWILRTFLQKG
jgi:hypothetical protein